MLISLLGDAGKEVLKQAGAKIASKVGEKIIERVPGRMLIEINKSVGFRRVTKAGEKLSSGCAANAINDVPNKTPLTLATPIPTIHP